MIALLDSDGKVANARGNAERHFPRHGGHGRPPDPVTVARFADWAPNTTVPD